MKKKILCMVMAAIIFTGCGKEKNEEANVQKRPIVSTAATMRVITDKYEADSNAIPKNKIDHSLDSAGTVVKIYKKNGDKVKKGELVIKLKDSKAEGEYYSARASFESAKSTFQTTKNNYNKYIILYNKKLVSETEFLDYKNKFTDAEGNYLSKKAIYLDNKEKNRKLSRTAEIDGVVGNLFLKEGAEVKQGDILFTIIDESEMEVSVDFPGKWFSKLEIGGPAEVIVGDLGNKTVKAYIKEINPVADIETKKYRVKLGINNDINSKDIIKDGMYVKAVVPAGKREVLTVPQESIVIRNLLSYIFLIKDGAVKRIEVTQGAVQAPYIEILSDVVKNGDKVVVEGLFGLADGDAVEEVVGTKK